MLGKVILCVAVAFYGLILKNNPLYRTELLGKVDLLLKNQQIELEEKVKEKVFSICLNLVIFGALGFIKTFEFAALLSGISLAGFNYLQNFDHNDPLNGSFVFVNFMALGMILIGLKLK